MTCLIASEWRDWQPGVWLFKPLASASFLWAALAWGARDSTYGRVVFVALILCAIGDVLLIPRGRGHVFLLGIGSFLLGHLVFAVAFLGLDVSRAGVAGGAFAVSVVALLGWNWLRPKLPSDFRVPVITYLVVIGVMVAVAMGAAFGAGMVVVGIDAVMVDASDLSVARRRFIASRFIEQLWGLPLYFGAQFLLASTVAVQM
ncbi:MAG: lysoplasmalogenase [Bacteroidetes bacterium]|nr:lysoplasmalogenase [Bacteroidota bacterium]